MSARIVGTLLAFSLFGSPACSSDTMSKAELVRWTRHFERKAGTGRHEVRFVVPGERSPINLCGWSFTDRGQLVAVYNLNCPRGTKVGGAELNEYNLARHEVLHERAGHHQRLCPRDAEDRPVRNGVCLDRDQAEAEVNELERVYR